MIGFFIGLGIGATLGFLLSAVLVFAERRKK